MKLPPESFRMVIQMPTSEKTKQVMRDIQLAVLKHFKDLPPNKSIFKIEIVQPVFIATPRKPKKTKA